MSIGNKKGWIRIGIVLSVMWLIVFWGYSGLLYQRATPFHGTWLFKQVNDQSQPVLQQEGHILMPVKPSLRILPFIAGTFGPIAVGWAFIIVAVSTIAWVSKGFQDEDLKKQNEYKDYASGQQSAVLDGYCAQSHSIVSSEIVRYAFDKKGIFVPENMLKNQVRIFALILSLVVFVAFTPGVASQWYQIGTGSSYDKELTISGLTHQQSTESASHGLRVDKAKRNGAIYAAFMVNGICIPLFFYLILSVIIITTPLSKAVNQKLFILFIAFFIWGVIFSGFAYSLISSLPIINAFLGAFGIWIVFTLIFGSILFIGLSMRKFLIRRRIALF